MDVTPGTAVKDFLGPNYESGGQEFESLRARHNRYKILDKIEWLKSAMQNEKICMASAWQIRLLRPAEQMSASAECRTRHQECSGLVRKLHQLPARDE